jgi:hypothetical protein
MAVDTIEFFMQNGELNVTGVSSPLRAVEIAVHMQCYKNGFFDFTDPNEHPANARPHKWDGCWCGKQHPEGQFHVTNYSQDSVIPEELFLAGADPYNWFRDIPLWNSLLDIQLRAGSLRTFVEGLLGRSFYPVGQHDSWAIFVLFIGVSGCGKGEVMAIMTLLHGADMVHTVIFSVPSLSDRQRMPAFSCRQRRHPCNPYNFSHTPWYLVYV